jgi:hypothetical protein
MVDVALRPICRNAVLAIRIYHHVEVKVTELHKAVDKHYRMLKVHVIVTSAVANEDAPPSQVLSALDHTRCVICKRVDQDS